MKNGRTGQTARPIMLELPTTLVLGAGASKPYRFPTGAELREDGMATVRHFQPFG